MSHMNNTRWNVIHIASKKGMNELIESIALHILETKGDEHLVELLNTPEVSNFCPYDLARPYSEVLHTLSKYGGVSWAGVPDKNEERAVPSASRNSPENLETTNFPALATQPPTWSSSPIKEGVSWSSLFANVQTPKLQKEAIQTNKGEEANPQPIRTEALNSRIQELR